jgi:hypothetical protein
LTGLTPAEREYLELTTQLVRLFGRICGGDISREQDVREHTAAIHGLQHRVMAQAAARAHPDRYRLLGEVIR